MKKKILIIVSTLIIIIIAIAVIYINDYYHADKLALECISKPAEGITVIEDDNIIVFKPKEIKAGIIFYPGGKVEAKSYALLMHELAKEGILSVIVRMPANLAVLDADAAEGIQEKYSDVDKWYMAGHSLGGSMAASYLSETEEEYEGLILLASYSLEDISKENIEVLSIYGEIDGVLNMENYSDNKSNLPSDYEEVIIEGGCHAYFGSYGEQDGDGKAKITASEQIAITVDEIVCFIYE